MVSVVARVGTTVSQGLNSEGRSTSGYESFVNHLFTSLRVLFTSLKDRKDTEGVTLRYDTFIE